MLLLPLFFAFTGLRTNVHLLMSPWLVLEALAILAMAVVGKAASPLLASRVLALSRREAIALGVLMKTPGLVELVVLNIGVDIGLLPPMLFTMLTLMALATTAMTSPLLAIHGLREAASAPGVGSSGHGDQIFVTDDDLRTSGVDVIVAPAEPAADHR